MSLEDCINKGVIGQSRDPVVSHAEIRDLNVGEVSAIWEMGDLIVVKVTETSKQILKTSNKYTKQLNTKQMKTSLFTLLSVGYSMK